MDTAKLKDEEFTNSNKMPFIDSLADDKRVTKKQAYIADEDTYNKLKEVDMDLNDSININLNSKL